jgi:signal transduction histidine kinase
MKLFIRFFSLGLNSDQTNLLQREILYTNIIAVLLMLTTALFYIAVKIDFPEVTYSMTLKGMLVGEICFCIPLLLNYFNRTTLSRIFICYLPIVYIWTLTIISFQHVSMIEDTRYDSLKILLLSVSLIPYLLFDLENKKLFILCIIPSFISVVGFEYILYQFEISHEFKGNLNNDYALMGIRSLIAYMLISISCISFHLVIYRQYLRNLKLQNLLMEQYDLIQEQNTILENHNIELSNHVIEKTSDLQFRNEQLQKFSYFNAHETRASLTKILGLIQVCKHEQNPDYNLYIDKILIETNKLERITRKLSEELE